MFVVTGATGALGRAVIQQLLTRVPASQIAATARDPEKARDLGVRVRRADFADAASLPDAFEGATKILIISVNDVSVAVEHHKRAIDAARAAGVARIFYSSQMGSNPTSPFPPMPGHAATEEYLKTCGVPFTSLRNGFYAASAHNLYARGISAGEIGAPADGPVAWTTHADLAEAAAIAMTRGGLDGITPPLTAGEAMDLSRVAELASEVTGKPVRRVVISDDEYRAKLIATGLPPHVANLLVGMFAAARLGHFSMVDPTLAGILGRAPTAFRDTLVR